MSETGIPNFQNGPAFAPDHEKRQHRRALVSWRAGIVSPDGSQILHKGKTSDISLGGACILIDTNISFQTPVRLLFAAPPREQNGKEQIFSVIGKQVYCMLQADTSLFKTGFQFLELEGDARRILTETIGL